MRVRTFTLNTKREIVSKITREILTLFHVEITGSEGTADYAQLSVVNRRLLDTPEGFVRMESTLILFDPNGNLRRFSCESTGAGDERDGAAVNRLIKLNLYRIFCEQLAMPQAPWGILHGVRPTKIVHRWIRYGLDALQIEKRLQKDYECSVEKAHEIVPMAFRQIPFLRMSDAQTISIYVGIPFCLTRCLYCSFPSNLLPNERHLREFMEILKKDLLAAKRDVMRFGFRVQNIYIGGGTPTSLPDDFFAEMIGMVYNAFYGDHVYEFTVEAGRPDSMTPRKIAEMKRRSVSRVSVNPQTMQLRTLRRIGRQHTPDDVRRMYHAIRKAGIPHINMDLILGLPGETAEDVRDTMEQVAALSPDGITLHALALKRGSRLRLLMDEQHVELPSDAETCKMFSIAMKRVESLGMKPYYLYRQGYMRGDLENVGCCRDGAESMYNIQIMEEHQTIIGIGGAAATKVVDARAGRLKSTFHAKDLMTYLRDIDYYTERRRTLLEEVYGDGRNS